MIKTKLMILFKNFLKQQIKIVIGVRKTYNVIKFYQLWIKMEKLINKNI